MLGLYSNDESPSVSLVQNWQICKLISRGIYWGNSKFTKDEGDEKKILFFRKDHYSKMHRLTGSPARTHRRTCRMIKLIVETHSRMRLQITNFKRLLQNAKILPNNLFYLKSQTLPHSLVITGSIQIGHSRASESFFCTFSFANLSSTLSSLLRFLGWGW